MLFYQWPNNIAPPAWEEWIEKVKGNTSNDDWLKNVRRDHMERGSPPGDRDKKYKREPIPLKATALGPLVRLLAKVLRGEVGGEKDGEN